jgi:hypothetical protein
MGVVAIESHKIEAEMDINRIIRELNDDRKRLGRIIEALEVIAKTGGGLPKPPSRRGRKFMDAAGRRDVSERMRRYWAQRREIKAADEAAKQERPEPENPIDESRGPKVVCIGAAVGVPRTPEGAPYMENRA